MRVVLLAACGAFLLAGAAVFIAGAGAASGPVFKVGFRVTAVGKSRPPNIVETRLAGKGTLLFDTVPDANANARTSSASGLVVVEYDVLTPAVPAPVRTERLTLAIDEGVFYQGETASGNLIYQLVRVFGKVSASSSAACPARSEMILEISRNVETNRSRYLLSLNECRIYHGQIAAIARNSPVQVSIIDSCLRPRSFAAVGGKPLCAAAAATCHLAGTWSQTTTDVGSTTWVITADGKAQEYGIGNASGTATLAGNVLTITWTTSNGYAGVYKWTLGANCSGTGTLTFTAVAPGDQRAGKSFPSTVQGPPPSP
jgi:hypothetical protein